MEIPRHWRLQRQRYNLVGEQCECGEKIFPPRDICPNCHQPGHQTEFKFSGKGEVYTHTTIYEAPAGFDQNIPYPVALVKLEEGPLITAQLTDLDPNIPVKIGDKVEMVTRKLKVDGDEDRGLIVYGYKFRPVFGQKQ